MLPRRMLGWVPDQKGTQMRMFVLSLAAVAALPGCMAEAPPSTQMAAASGQVRCVPVRQITARRATGPRSLEFEMAGGITYRNDLPAVCPGLENRTGLDAIALEVDGSQICAGDSFRAFEPGEAKVVGIRAFPRCRLGAFTRTERAAR